MPKTTSLLSIRKKGYDVGTAERIDRRYGGQRSPGSGEEKTMANCKRTVIRGPLALFLGSVPGRRLECADQGRLEGQVEGHKNPE